MLRNRNQVPTEHRNVEILNEVLSLNAQECQEYRPRMAHLQFLNEVLSLNAQESVTCYANR